VIGRGDCGSSNFHDSGSRSVCAAGFAIIVLLICVFLMFGVIIQYVFTIFLKNVMESTKHPMKAN
jgi:hypothetical protein